MIGVIVTFRYGSDFSEERVRQVAEAARGQFEGMPGLRSQVFTLDARRREAINFSVWNSEEAARAFFTPDLLARVGEAYGVSPDVRFMAVAAIVESSSAEA
jgi:heme-degrading monooxygenase HmoA